MNLRHWRFTLLADGPSDAALLPVLNWLWQQHRQDDMVTGRFAEFGDGLVQSRRIEDRVAPALELYPCDVLFVHRDAEKEPMKKRLEEIRLAVETAGTNVPAVCVVPVRMTEAWMLFDAAAIRRAAGNPNGTQALKLPPLSRVESLPDPKAVLHETLRKASGLSPQRLARFNVRSASRLVTEHVDDFSPLRRLDSFARTEEEFCKLNIK